MVVDIPGRGKLEIKNVVFDFNGTMAVDGRLVPGTAEMINDLADRADFHVITADTFGTVEQQLAGVNCRVVKIPPDNQDQAKLDYVAKLGLDTAMCLGNGRNDKLMLKEAALGVAVLLDEGAWVETVMAADLICKSVLDALAYLSVPDRLRATARN